MREKFMAMRDMPEEERPKAAERNRAEIREKMMAILNDEQKKRYTEIIAEQAGRAPSRGRVWVAEAGDKGKGQPKVVQLRLGLTDGSMTEIVGGDLKEGQEVLVGLAPTAGKGGAAAPAGAPRGPRMPF
jgi:HlyD family secretion protein